MIKRIAALITVGSELLMLTSMPPRQSLTFTLDDARYRLYVMRSDLVPRVIPAH